MRTLLWQPLPGNNLRPAPANEAEVAMGGFRRLLRVLTEWSLEAGFWELACWWNSDDIQKSF